MATVPIMWPKVIVLYLQFLKLAKIPSNFTSNFPDNLEVTKGSEPESNITVVLNHLFLSNSCRRGPSTIVNTIKKLRNSKPRELSATKDEDVLIFLAALGSEYESGVTVMLNLLPWGYFAEDSQRWTGPAADSER